MGDIYSILKKPTGESVNGYLETISKRMDIDNCKTMVNTYVPGVRFTTETLIQHCKDNNIKYFTRGEYDIFTLEEIELIEKHLKKDEYQKAFDLYKKTYPKRHTDLTLQQFESKLKKIKEEKENQKREELKPAMRFTNDVIEYVQDLGREHTIVESLELIQKKYPNLKMDMAKLEDMKERYLIRFLTEDNSFFTKDQVDTILRLGQTCNSLKETYNIFIGMYPDKCTFTQFVIEISKLKTLAVFNAREGVGKFTPLEDAYIVELSKEDKDALSLYTDFNMVFPNRCPFIQFSSRLNELKVENLPKEEKVHRGREADPMNGPLEEFIRSFNSEKTINELVELVNNDGRFKTYNYNNLYNFLYLRKIPYKAEEKKAKSKSKTNSITPIKNNGKGKKSLLETIHDDVVITVEQNTISDALAELKEKHPDIADKLTYSMLIMYAKRRNLNYLKGNDEKVVKNNKDNKHEKMLEKLEKARAAKSDGFADKIYEYLKEIHKDYTQQECLELVNKKFGLDYKGNYISNLVSRKGKLEFKKYEEFTDEMKDILNGLRQFITNKHSLYQEFSKTFKGAFKAAEFYSLLDILETENSKIVVHNTADTNKPQIMVVPVGVKKEGNVIVPEIQVEVQENTNEVVKGVIKEETVQINTTNPYQPIIDEVNDVFNKKCEQLNVVADTTSHTEEIISALETLIRYAQQKDILKRRVNDHEDILEEYRREVEHEIEIQPWSETDTYCQNKIKAIALKRRDIKYFKDDLSKMEPLLNSILTNIDGYTKTLNSLKYVKSQRDNAVYVPRVDTSMVDKYDWCVKGSAGSVRANTPILQTNARLDRARQRRNGEVNNTTAVATRAENVTIDPNINSKSRTSKYRVQAEFMVLDGQVFARPYHDVFSTSEEKAVEASKTYFENLSKKKGNAKYTILGATRLNVEV